MPAKNTLLASAEKAERSTRLPFAFLMAVSSITTFQGLNVILPGEGAMHYGTATVLAGATFAGLHTIWTHQKEVFVEMASKHIKRSTLALHIAGAATAFCLSTPTTYISMVWEDASIRDAQFAQQRAEDQGNDIKRDFHGAASITHFIEGKANTMNDLAKAAKRGDLSGYPGTGVTYKRYISIGEQLTNLSDLIKNSQADFEDGIQRMDVAHRKMRQAIETEDKRPLSETVTAFEAGYREYSHIYTAMAAVTLGDQIQRSLDGVLESAIVADDLKPEIRKSLQLAERQAARTVGEISEYVQTKHVTINPLPAYRLDSPAIVSFRYLREYWVQAIFSFALDGCLLIAIWMQVQARRADRFDDDVKPYTKDQVELIRGLAEEVADIRDHKK